MRSITSLAMLPSVMSLSIASAEDHSYAVGKAGIDEFLINWTDNKKYTGIWDDDGVFQVTSVGGVKFQIN